MTLKNDVAKMIHAGMGCEEIVQHFRMANVTHFRPYKYRNAYASIMGPEAMERIRANEKKPEPLLAKPETIDGIEKVYKEVMVGIQSDLRDKNNGGGIKKMLISLPRVKWLERSDV